MRKQLIEVILLFEYGIHGNQFDHRLHYCLMFLKVTCRFQSL